MKIKEVPESLPRADVVAFFHSVGIDPKWCTSIELRADGIYAEVFARGEDGQKVILHYGVATHKVYIPFV